MLNPYVKQRTKQRVQDGRPMAEFSLAATKQREVEPYDSSVMAPLRLLVGIALFASYMQCTVVGRTTTIPLARISGPR